MAPGISWVEYLILTWWSYFKRLQELRRWGLIRESRSLEAILLKLYMVPRPFLTFFPNLQEVENLPPAILTPMTFH